MTRSSYTILLLSALFLFACAQKPAPVVRSSGTSASNNLSDSYLTASSPEKNPFIVQIKQGQTLYDISKNHGINLRTLIEYNRLYPPYELTPGNILRLPKPQFHTVQPKETLYTIGQSYGVDISQLVERNHLTEPYTIYPGTKLRLPAATTEVSTANKASFASPSSGRYRGNIRKAPVNLLKLEEPQRILPLSLDQRPALLTGDEVGTGLSSAAIEAGNLPPIPLAPQPILKNGTLAITADKKTNALTTKNTPIVALKGKNEAPIPIYKNQPYQQALDPNKPVSFQWPIKGKILSTFGEKSGGLRNDGVTISAAENTPIRAAADGIVVYSGDALRGYGNLLLLKHNENFVTVYAHAKKMLVSKGALVHKGEIIGYVGMSGKATTPQLHFGIRKGKKPINPGTYLR